eukprot:SAG22_NODE_4364_length_1292_cov_1.864208_1_plen_143_part_00
MVIERVKYMYGISIGLRTIEVLPWAALFDKKAPGEAKKKVQAQPQTGKAHVGPIRASFRYTYMYTFSGTVIEYCCITGGGGGEEGCALSVQIQLPRLRTAQASRRGRCCRAQTPTEWWRLTPKWAQAGSSASPLCLNDTLFP